MSKKEQKKEKTQLKKATKTWGEVIDAYTDLREKHKVFCKTAEGVNHDLAGPGLSEALQRLFHRRNFNMFLEDLMFEDFRKGGISQLVPPTESSGKKGVPNFS